MDSLYAGIALFQQGGFAMYILLCCSIFVVYIAVERFLYFKRYDDGRGFSQAFCNALHDGDRKKATQIAQNGHGHLAKILVPICEGSMTMAPATYGEMHSGIAISYFRRRLYYLNVIVTMAPLLGLLGTIIGMIQSFSIFHIQSAQASAITGGVGEALICTAFGLCVAMISLSIHAYFTQWLDGIITDMELCLTVAIDGVRKEEKDHAATL